MFKRFRADVWNISDTEVQNLNDELLLKEYEHINKIIEEKEKTTNNLTLLLISGLGVVFWNIIQGISNVFKFFYENNNSTMADYLKLNLPSLFEMILISACICIFIFFCITILELLNRKKIINRKNLIADLIKKNKKL